MFKHDSTEAGAYEAITAWLSGDKTDSMDAAWARVTAVLPEGWDMGLTCLTNGDRTAWAGWYADGDPEHWIDIEAQGASPAAALNALATRLEREWS